MSEASAVKRKKSRKKKPVATETAAAADPSDDATATAATDASATEPTAAAAGGTIAVVEDETKQNGAGGAAADELPSVPDSPTGPPPSAAAAPVTDDATTTTTTTAADADATTSAVPDIPPVVSTDASASAAAATAPEPAVAPSASAAADAAVPAPAVDAAPAAATVATATDAEPVRVDTPKEQHRAEADAKRAADPVADEPAAAPPAAAASAEPVIVPVLANGAAAGGMRMRAQTTSVLLTDTKTDPYATSNGTDHSVPASAGGAVTSVDDVLSELSQFTQPHNPKALLQLGRPARQRLISAPVSRRKSSSSIGGGGASLLSSSQHSPTMDGADGSGAASSGHSPAPFDLVSSSLAASHAASSRRSFSGRISAPVIDTKDDDDADGDGGDGGGDHNDRPPPHHRTNSTAVAAAAAVRAGGSSLLLSRAAKECVARLSTLIENSDAAARTPELLLDIELAVERASELNVPSDDASVVDAKRLARQLHAVESQAVAALASRLPDALHAAQARAHTVRYTSDAIRVVASYVAAVDARNAQVQALRTAIDSRAADAVRRAVAAAVAFGSTAAGIRSSVLDRSGAIENHPVFVDAQSLLARTDAQAAAALELSRAIEQHSIARVTDAITAATRAGVAEHAILPSASAAATTASATSAATTLAAARQWVSAANAALTRIASLEAAHSDYERHASDALAAADKLGLRGDAHIIAARLRLDKWRTISTALVRALETTDIGFIDTAIANALAFGFDAHAIPKVGSTASGADGAKSTDFDSKADFDESSAASGAEAVTDLTRARLWQRQLHDIESTLARVIPLRRVEALQPIVHAADAVRYNSPLVVHAKNLIRELTAESNARIALAEAGQSMDPQTVSSALATASVLGVAVTDPRYQLCERTLARLGEWDRLRRALSAALTGKDEAAVDSLLAKARELGADTSVSAAAASISSLSASAHSGAAVHSHASPQAHHSHATEELIHSAVNWKRSLVSIRHQLTAAIDCRHAERLQSLLSSPLVLESGLKVESDPVLIEARRVERQLRALKAQLNAAVADRDLQALTDAIRVSREFGLGASLPAATAAAGDATAIEHATSSDAKHDSTPADTGSDDGVDPDFAEARVWWNRLREVKRLFDEASTAVRLNSATAVKSIDSALALAETYKISSAAVSGARAQRRVLLRHAELRTQLSDAIHATGAAAVVDLTALRLTAITSAIAAGLTSASEPLIAECTQLLDATRVRSAYFTALRRSVEQKDDAACSALLRSQPESVAPSRVGDSKSDSSGDDSNTKNGDDNGDSEFLRAASAFVTDNRRLWTTLNASIASRSADDMTHALARITESGIQWTEAEMRSVESARVRLQSMLHARTDLDRAIAARDRAQLTDILNRARALLPDSELSDADAQLARWAEAEAALSAAIASGNEKSLASTILAAEQKARLTSQSSKVLATAHAALLSIRSATAAEQSLAAALQSTDADAIQSARDALVRLNSSSVTAAALCKRAAATVTRLTARAQFIRDLTEAVDTSNPIRCEQLLAAARFSADSDADSGSISGDAMDGDADSTVYASATSLVKRLVETRAALDSATQSGSAERLEAALQSAKRINLSPQTEVRLQFAAAALSKLIELKVELRTAVASSVVSQLRASVIRASANRLAEDDTDLVAARRALTRITEFDASVEAAIRSRSVHELTKIIAAADADGSRDANGSLVASARSLLSDLKTESDLTLALADATDSKDISSLEAVLNKCNAFGFNRIPDAAAGWRLLDVLKQQRDVLKSLAAAVSRCDATSVESLLRRAAQLEIDELTPELATAQSWHLHSARHKSSLDEAVARRDTAAIEPAIELAARFGWNVSAERAVLAQLNGLKQQLRDACDAASRSLLALASALRVASSGDCALPATDSDVVSAVRIRKQLTEIDQQIDAALSSSSASSGGDASAAAALARALQSADSNRFASDNVTRARSVLAQLNRERAASASAVRDIDSLRSALDRVSTAGVSAQHPIVLAARQSLARWAEERDLARAVGAAFERKDFTATVTALNAVAAASPAANEKDDASSAGDDTPLTRTVASAQRWVDQIRTALKPLHAACADRTIEAIEPALQSLVTRFGLSASAEPLIRADQTLCALYTELIEDSMAALAATSDAASAVDAISDLQFAIAGGAQWNVSAELLRDARRVLRQSQTRAAPTASAAVASTATAAAVPSDGGALAAAVQQLQLQIQAERHAHQSTVARAQLAIQQQHHNTTATSVSRSVRAEDGASDSDSDASGHDEPITGADAGGDEPLRSAASGKGTVQVVAPEPEPVPVAPSPVAAAPPVDASVRWTLPAGTTIAATIYSTRRIPAVDASNRLEFESQWIHANDSDAVGLSGVDIRVPVSSPPASPAWTAPSRDFVLTPQRASVQLIGSRYAVTEHAAVWSGGAAIDFDDFCAFVRRSAGAAAAAATESGSLLLTIATSGKLTAADWVWARRLAAESCGFGTATAADGDAASSVVVASTAQALIIASPALTFVVRAGGSDAAAADGDSKSSPAVGVSDRVLYRLVCTESAALRYLDAATNSADAAANGGGLKSFADEFRRFLPLVRAELSARNSGDHAFVDTVRRGLIPAEDDLRSRIASNLQRTAAADSEPLPSSAADATAADNSSDALIVRSRDSMNSNTAVVTAVSPGVIKVAATARELSTLVAACVDAPERPQFEALMRHPQSRWLAVLLAIVVILLS